MVRREETICRSHERALHRVRGLSPGEIAALTVVEHGQLEPGDVGRGLRRWEALARRGWVYRPGSDPCGIPQCCGPGPRGVLEQAIGYLWTSPSRAASASHRAAAAASHRACVPRRTPQASTRSCAPGLIPGQKIGMSPQPGLPAEERRGDHPGEHAIKPGQPPRGINLPTLGATAASWSIRAVTSR